MDSNHRRPRPIKSVDGFYNSPGNRPTFQRSLSDSLRPTEYRLPKPVTERQANPLFPARQPMQQRTPVIGVSTRTRASLPNSSKTERRGFRFWKRKANKQRRKRPVRRVVFTMLSLAIVAILAVGGWLDWNLNKIFHCGLTCGVQALSTPRLKGEAQGRVNILLAGDSADDPDHGGALLTDSIMLVSIDTKNHTGFMLSIPRDLWVNIPGWGYEKINAANDASNFNQPGYPQGGMGQLEQVVQTDLGIPVDYYGLIDYSAFRDTVNAVGGIKVDIQSSDPRGIYDAYTHLNLPNGWVELNGSEALALARARGDEAAGDVSYGLPNSDYDRTMHQRQMLVALGQKATTAGVLTNPIRISQLFSAIGKNVQTDMTLGDVARLAQLTRGVKLSQLQSLTYPSTATATNNSPALLTNYTDPASGEEALIPTDGIGDFGGLQQYYQQLVTNNPIVKESPSVVVLNASDVNGLAHYEAKILESKGFNVVSITDANNQHPGTMVVDDSNGQMPLAKQSLQRLFPDHSPPVIAARQKLKKLRVIPLTLS